MTDHGMDARRNWGVPDLLALRAELLAAGETAPIEVTFGQFEQLLAEQMGVWLPRELWPRPGGWSLVTRCTVEAGTVLVPTRTVLGVVKKATEEGERLDAVEGYAPTRRVDFYPAGEGKRCQWHVPFRLLDTGGPGFQELYHWASGGAVAAEREDAA